MTVTWPAGSSVTVTVVVCINVAVVTLGTVLNVVAAVSAIEDPDEIAAEDEEEVLFSPQEPLSGLQPLESSQWAEVTPHHPKELQHGPELEPSQVKVPAQLPSALTVELPVVEPPGKAEAVAAEELVPVAVM